MTRFRLAVLVALLVAASLRAQSAGQRYELGRHLLAFEDALDAQTDEAARQRALATLKPVTGQFFSLQFGKAAQTLDRARFDLMSERKPEPVVLWAQSLSVVPEARLLDRTAGGVPFKVSAFYKTDGQPEKFQVRLTLLDGKPVAGPLIVDVASLPFEGTLPLKDVPQGDAVLRWEILVDGKPLAQREQALSLADRLEERLTKVNAAVRASDGKPATTDRESLRRLAQMLTSLNNKESQETDYPALRLLVEAEQAAQAVADGKAFYGRKKPGDFYLALAIDGKAEPVRLSAPPTAQTGEPLPLVIVLHGAGGSENLFFDGHGRGAVVKLGRARGWLVVATRNGLPDGLVDAVDKLYPVDRKRVFLIGHSLGAAQTVQAASAHPERFVAVAALGGGGGLQPSEALKDLPFFVGVGTEDFLFAGARKLRDDLKKAEVKKAVYKEYAGLEHLTIVQLGLKDVYAFFDEVVKKNGPP